MRILYGITYFLPHVSGLTLGLVPIAKAAATAGYDVSVIAAQASPDLPEDERLDGLQVRRVPVSFWVGKGPVMLSHARRIFASLHRGDVLHLFLPQFDAGPAAVMARLRGARVVLTYVCSFTAPGVRGAVSMAAARLSHLVAGLLAHEIVALSEDYARQSAFCRLFRRKLRFIPLPVRNYPATALPRRTPKPPYRIGFVGRIAAEKNLGLLLDALPELRSRLDEPFTLELVGPEDPPVSHEQTALLHRLATCDAPELRRHGKIADAALEAFYREIDVLVLPSTDRIEAYGLVQVEAMLRGTPCVTSDRPGMREPIALTGFGQVFPPGDAVALAAAVAQALRRSFDVTPEQIHATFDPSRIAAAYEAVYSGHTDGVPAPRPSAM